MAFFNKAGSILRQAACSKHIGQKISASSPSIFQTVRCMSTKLFIGGLSYGTDESSLREAFEKYGDVTEAKIIIDRDSGRSRGFGFVTYSTLEDANSAIKAFDNQDFQGRRLRVNIAQERPQGGFNSGGYGGSGGGYGGSGYGGNRGGYGGSGGGGYGGSSAGGGYGGGGSAGGYGGGGSAGGYGGSGNFGGGNNVGFGNNSQNSGTSYASGGSAGYNPDPLGDLKDDDEPDDFASKRA